MFVVLIFLFVSCTSTKRVASVPSGQNVVSNKVSGDGSSFEKAVVIMKYHESEGVAAEYVWLRENYPGCKFKGQALSKHNKIPYDILNFTTAEGVEKSIYFDISNFYGK